MQCFNMNHSDLNVSNFVRIFIGPKRFKNAQQVPHDLVNISVRKTMFDPYNHVI